MYILEAPDDVQAVFYGFSDYLLDMLRRAFLCLTAFFAAADVFPWNTQAVVGGVQAQYLLGLGKCIMGVGVVYARSSQTFQTSSNRHW